MSPNFSSKPISLNRITRPTAGRGYQSPLQRMTAQYQTQQAAVTQKKEGEIEKLSTQGKRITTAAVTAEKPVQQYLQRAGGMIDQRVLALQRSLHEKIQNQKK